MNSKRPTGDKAYGARIKKQRESMGLNQTDFGARFGVGQGAVGQWETGLTLPSSKTILALAKLGVAAPGESEAEDVRHTVPVGPIGQMPIKHRVMAGNWIEQDDIADEPIGYAAITPRPEIPEEDQWAEVVIGDSFNMRFPEGTILHVRSGFGADPRKLHGKRVIIQRTRQGGHYRERSVKEVVVTAKGEVEFWPRSFNPKWSSPIKWRDGLRDGDTVEIAGLVLSATLLE